MTPEYFRSTSQRLAILLLAINAAKSWTVKYVTAYKMRIRSCD